VTGLSLRQPLLDDVFLALTGRPAEEVEPADLPAPQQLEARA
jgi:hypothetical protein